MTLFAERGFAGASLRELARRLNISQPSLYHYFVSKDDLVEQIIQFAVTRVRVMRESEAPPACIEDVPEYTRRLVFTAYDNPLYRVVLRFTLAVALERPEYRSQLRDLFNELQASYWGSALDSVVGRRNVEAERADFLFRLVTNAIGFCLLEDRIVFGREADDGPDLARFADFVVELANQAVAAQTTAA
jgi:AcrR family transcriptional regulator